MSGSRRPVRREGLAHDTRGAALAELVIVIIPFLTFALGIVQLIELYTGKLLVDHAAVHAARSATVVFPDDPVRYGGEPVNAETPRRTAAVRLSAARAISPFLLDGTMRTVDVSFPSGIPKERGASLTVEVRSAYRCGVPLVYRLVCPGGTVELVGRSTLPSHSADYQY